MKIYIPTYGRSERLPNSTYHKLPKQLQNKTTLVVQNREKDKYAGYNILVLPDHIRTIAPTRQWIMDQHDIKVTRCLMMMDDDLVFSKRREDDKGKFGPCTDKDFLDMYKDVKSALRKYTHVGLMAREGGNRCWVDAVAARMYRVLAYDVAAFRASKVKFYRPLNIPPHDKFTMEDFDCTLQLLRAGHANLVLAKWLQGQGSSNAKGGCSSFRTLELHAQSANALATLHAPFVKVVEKSTKTAWGGEARLDVTVQWKRAYESSK